MRKNAFYCKAMVIVLGIFLLPQLPLQASAYDSAPESAAVMKLLRICGSAHEFASPPTPQSCLGSDIFIDVNETCNASLPASVYLTNIADEINSNGNYNLPIGIPPIHVRYEYSPGVWLVTEALTHVVYKGTMTDDSGEGILIFGLDVNLDTYYTESTPCEPDEYRIHYFNQGIEVVTPRPNGYDLYPVLDHADEDTGLFSCKVFSETNCQCGKEGFIDCSGALPPSYDFEVCMQCDCNRNGESVDVDPIKGNINVEQNSEDIFNITPNPFNDFVEIKTVQHNANEIAELKIFNALGELVHSSENTLSRGINKFNINTSKFSAGTYYFIYNDGLTQQSRKMILMDN